MLREAKLLITGLFIGTLVPSLLLSSAASATDYSISASSSGSVNLVTNAGNTVIDSSEINVTTNCRAGYNLTLGTSVSDNNLYLNGDSTNNTEGTYLSPISGSTTLNASSNTWGYYYSSNSSAVPTTSNTFLPVPTSTNPVAIKTTQDTASDSDIDDTFNVYYGANAGLGLTAGTYRMITDSTTNQAGGLTYYFTANPTCTINLDITFAQNAGEDTVTNFPTSSDNTLDSLNNTLTLSDKVPVRDGYVFTEWNTSSNGTGTAFAAGETITIGAGTGELSGDVTLYAIWELDPACPAGYICYHGNGADAGTMNNQSASSNTKTILIASNYSRAGYGFAGWSTVSDITDTTVTPYGPNATITTPDLSSEGLKLYAKWVRKSGNLQTWSSCSTMNTGDVIALRDVRDDEVYTVSKLADNNCWITENLRLVPSTASISVLNTNNPTSAFITAAPSSSSTTSQCAQDSAACNDQVYYYTGNMDRTKTQQPTGNDAQYAWYSYGSMYNWYTATAGNGIYTQTSGNVAGDICPAGWRLPTGDSSGEYTALSTALGGTSSTGAANLHAYPNNFINSGDYNPSSEIPDGRGTQGRIWSATPQNAAKSYRMGYNNTSITPSGTWNKWDNFAVRCIYQGGNTPYLDLTVDFEDAGISSVSFTNSNYGTVTATPANPTATIVDNVTYTITATPATGYRFSSWATDEYGTLGSDTTNPTTYIVTDEATLSVASTIIPTHATTVTLGEHITSVSFTNASYGTQTVTNNNGNQDGTDTGTVNLREGVEYTITATFANGYKLNAWTNGVNSTIGSTSISPTTFTITGASTLSVTATEADTTTYTLVYDAGSGTDAPASETATSQNATHDFTITNLAPIYYGYTFTGWTETLNSTTVDYTSGDTITVPSTGATTTKTLYAVYQQNTCPPGKICYYDNGADVNNGGRNTMSNQNASSNSSANLIPSNYSRTGYGFAGWATSANATPYGPNATITTGDLSSQGLALYAKWVAPTGNLHDWNGCNSLQTGDVIALTDTRDNNVYTVAKLADNNCWTTENLRLVPSTATINTNNTHNPTSTFISEAASSSSSTTMCKADSDTTCLNSVQFNANSLDRTLTPSYNTAASNVGWYSYGVYYNWYTATAGNGTYETTGNTTVNGDICPKKWHIPTGNNGEWVTLNNAANGSTSNDTGLRAYPVNLIWSGDYNNTKRTSGYSNGRMWSSTANANATAYRMGYASNTVTPNNSYNKWDGFAIRCVYDGDTVDHSDLTVTLPTGVESITFTNATYGTETATTSSPTVSLAEGATYTMTATFAPGYELGSWTGGNNTTIADTTANPTTIIITDDSTLTLTTSEIPTYTVTVSLDSGSTSITFTNANYPTQTVTTTGSTVSLRRGVEYTITATFDTTNGYVFDSWTAGSGSTIGSTNQNPTTYVVTNTSTLSLTSKQKTGQTTLLRGQELNTKMKTLAEGTSTSYNTDSSKIKSLQMADSLPTGFTPSSADTVSVDGSENPIYIFFDNTNDAGIMYFYTDAKDIYMNADSSDAFSYNTALTDVSALSSWNTSNVTNMGGMFRGASFLTNIDALANWDTSSVTNMSYMFEYASSLTNIDGASSWNTSSVIYMGGMFRYASFTNIDALANWNTSGVTNMSSMFSYASSLTNIDALANWDTSSVTNMSSMFSYGSLTNIDGASSWDTSNVTNMSSMFDDATALTNIDGASNWDTSSVTNMSGMFDGAFALTNIDALANWNTSSVTNMSYMFEYATALTNIDGASSWDTSSVTNMSEMFHYAHDLTNIDGATNWNTGSVKNMSNMFSNTNSNINGSAINNWDVRSVTATAGDSTYNNNNFFCMFGRRGYGAASTSCTSTYSNHPEFTTRSGTWNSGGTFIPGDTTPVPVTTTVSFDSHISSIQFYGVFPGSNSSTTQTISTSGSTISLNRGNSYRITATLSSGYELALWDPGEHGKIPAKRITLNTGEGGNTNFTPTGNTTLTATSQPIPSDVTTTVNMDSNITRVSFYSNKYGRRVTTSSNGSTVTLKQGTTYRVTTATNSGYEVSTYTATGATITSTAGPHTDFTPSGASSLTITSTTNTPTHTVTVNMDSNVSYVTFTNPDWPSKTAIRNGFTVDLRDNTPYTATAYTKDGYVLSSWTVGANATLSSTTTNPTTFTITGDSTLTATSEPIPTYTTTVNLDSGIRTITISNPRYGTQEITSNNTPITLYEGIEYTITAETKDGSEFSSWSTDSSGTLSSTTDNPTTFTISGTSTLSASTQALPAHQVTVNLDQGISSIGFYNTDLGTQQVTTTGSTVNLYDNTDYIITAATNTGFNFATWTTGPNGTLTDATSNPTSYSVTSDTTLSATTTDNRILINYDGNGLYYNNDPTDTINQVYYENTKSTTTETITRYAHTANVSDAGVASGNYANNLDTTDTVTIDGATSLNVTIYYDAQSTSYDWVSVYGDPFNISTANDATVSTTTGNLSGKLSGRKSGRTTSYTTWYSQTYAVTGNTVKFHFKSNASTAYYGYYAVITADVTTTTDSFNPISGTYATPSSSDPHTFLGWSEDSTATTPTYTDEQDLIDNATYTHSDSPVTLYAIYGIPKTVTVNLDSNITSVSFTNSNFPTQTITTSGDTVNLYTNTEYITTATFSTGYALGTWSTTANGTLSSTATNPTTYTITDTTTLTVTSNLATQTVTVNLPTNVTSVSFTNNDYGTQTVIVDHGTVTLYHGVPYTITATVDPNSRYIFNNWTTSVNGTLTDANTNPTTYTVTGNATLTPNIEKIKHSVTVNFDSGVSSVIFHKSPYLNQTITTSGDAVNLAEDEAYTVTTRLNNGYVFTSYATAANGTLTSTTDNPTTYTVTDSSTLTITTTAIPTHTVTVNMDSNVTSISFSNQNYATETVNTNGGTVTLREGVLYQVSSTYNTGYTANSWTTTANGTLSNTTQSNNTYIVTGDATLSLTSRAEVATTLLPGQDLNAKMKTLAEGKSTEYYDESSKIKSLRMADSLPSGFTPSSANTVSTPSSTYPVYIFFDNTDDAGIMYFYTEARDIYMNTNSSHAFFTNTALTDISAVSSWDTSSVTSMIHMFSGASSLVSIDALANWNTSSVTNMSYMFYNASSLTNIDALANWNTSSVTNMGAMFSSAHALTNIDGARNWNTSSVTNMSAVFASATALTNIDGAANWNTNSVTNMSEMFHGATALTNIDGAANWDTGNVTEMGKYGNRNFGMFSDATSLTNIDGASNWNTSSVTNMSYMFYNASSLTNIDALANWDTSRVTGMTGMFAGATALTNIDGAANWDTGNVTEMGKIGIGSFGMFSGATSLTNIDGAINWDTSSVTNMSYMFEDARALTNIDGATNWDTSNVTNMSNMFDYARALTNIDALANWDTSNVTNMSNMFDYARALTNIDALANWDTSSVTDMNHMFSDATSLTNTSSADNWDVRAVTATAGSSSSSSNNFYKMFYRAGGSSTSAYHPTFTTRSGTWNSEGTFIPGDTTPASTTNSTSSTSTPSSTPSNSSLSSTNLNSASSATSAPNTTNSTSTAQSTNATNSISPDSTTTSPLGVSTASNSGQSDLDPSSDSSDSFDQALTINPLASIAQDSTNLGPALLIAAATSALTGAALLAFAASKKDDDDDDE